MTKAELEARVKELEGQVVKLKKDIKDIGVTAEVYEMSALRYAEHCSMSNVMDVGLSFLKGSYDW